MAYTPPWQLFGTWVSGDVDEITIYTDRFGRKVAFPKAPPEKPPSPRQIHQRERFRLAHVAWKALTDSEKAQLELAALRGSLVMTGQNLYISVALRNDSLALLTLQRQTQTNLPAVPFIA